MNCKEFDKLLKEFHKLLTIQNILDYVLYTIVTIWFLSLLAIFITNSWISVIIFGIIWLIMLLVGRKCDYIDDKVYEYKLVIININKYIRNNGTTCSKDGD